MFNLRNVINSLAEVLTTVQALFSDRHFIACHSLAVFLSLSTAVRCWRGGTRWEQRGIEKKRVWVATQQGKGQMSQSKCTLTEECRSLGDKLPVTHLIFQKLTSQYLAQSDAMTHATTTTKKKLCLQNCLKPSWHVLWAFDKQTSVFVNSVVCCGDVKTRAIEV